MLTALQPEGSDFQGRHRVRYEDGSGEAHVRPAKMIYAGYRSCIIVCSETWAYRSLARALPLPADTVLEIGSSHGEATKLLAEGAGRVVGVEISRSLIASSRKAHAARSNVSFVELDALQNPRGLHELAADADLCFADLGGTRPLSALLELLPPLLERCAPFRTVVVKCREMHAAVMSGQREGGSGLWPEVLARLQRTEAAAAVAAAVEVEVAAPAQLAAVPMQAAAVTASDLVASSGGAGGSPATPEAAAPPSATEEDEMTRAATADASGSSPAAVEEALRAAFRLYPLKYKPRAAPSGKQICRFHNFGVCRNHACQYDHAHCHYCGGAGHVALRCAAAEQDLARGLVVATAV